MAQFIAKSAGIVGFPDVSVPSSAYEEQLALPGANPQQLVSDANVRSHAAPTWNDPRVATQFIGSIPTGREQGTYMANSMHKSYHYRIWVIPGRLQLTNPQLNTDIPFDIWNTFPKVNALNELTVDGSEVLSFDLGVGDTLREYQQRETQMVIGPGEPTIDATATFDFAYGDGHLVVSALVSETFNLVPDVPVTERWEYLTDIIESHNGSEQRICLRDEPRLSQDFTVEIIDLMQRKSQYSLLSKNIMVQSLVPQYQYTTTLTKTALPQDKRVYFEPSHTQMRVGEFLIAINPQTEATFLGKVVELHADGCTLQSPVGQEITPDWAVCPSITCMLGDGSGLFMNQTTGKLKVSAKSYVEPQLERPAHGLTLATLDGLPVLERRHLTPAPEQFSYPREILDNDTGLRTVKSRHPHAYVGGTREYRIDRLPGSLDMDYWRLFLNTVKGAQKAFLMNTYFPDLTSAESSVQGKSSIRIVEHEYGATMFQWETWKHVEIEYDSGKTTRHTVTDAPFIDKLPTISLSPQIPLDPDYDRIKRISFLLKVRGDDKVTLEHHAQETYLKWSFKTVD